MKTIERMSIVQQVIDNLLSYIEDHNCKAGDKMPTEKEICEMLGVGRSTVREAYRMLQAMNMVVAVQGKGVFVADPGKKEKESGLNWFKQHGSNMMDFMEIRTALETMAVRLAIRRANEQDIRKLEKIHKCFVKSIETGNEVSMASYDEAFHNQIALMSHNTLMEKLQEILAECFSEYRLELYKIEENQQHAIEPHERIVEAFREKDEEKGVEVMLNHLQISTQDMQNAMKGSVTEN